LIFEEMHPETTDFPPSFGYFPPSFGYFNLDPRFLKSPPPQHQLELEKSLKGAG
jgi:hypothetical protein